MNKGTFKKGIGELCITFRQEVDEYRNKLYWEHLRDLTNEDFEKAVKTIIGKNKFFPMIAEIREVAIDKEQDVIDAWNEFQEKDYDFDNPRVPHYENKILYGCLRFLGGVRAIADVPRRDEKFLRKDFIGVYRILKRRQDFEQIKLPERKVAGILKEAEKSQEV